MRHTLQYFCELRNHITTHFISTSTKTGVSEAAKWGRTPTPTKFKQPNVLPHQEYLTRRPLDPLGLLDKREDEATQDPRAKR